MDSAFMDWSVDEKVGQNFLSLLGLCHAFPCYYSYKHHFLTIYMSRYQGYNIKIYLSGNTLFFLTTIFCEYCGIHWNIATDNLFCILLFDLLIFAERFCVQDFFFIFHWAQICFYKQMGKYNPKCLPAF